MSDNHALDFVCVSCWEGFQVDSGKVTDDQESVVCPHCGADVPIPKTAEEDEAEDDAAASEDEGEATGKAKASKGKKKRAAPQAVLVDEDADVEEEEEEQEPVEEVEPSTEPEEILWRVQVPGGLAYNFHGISTLKRWCGTKRNLGGIAVGYQHEAWRKLDQFMDRLLDGEETLTAYAACDAAVDAGLPTPGQDGSGGFSSAHNAFASIPSLEEIEAQIGSSYTGNETITGDFEEQAEELDISNEDSFGDLTYTSPSDEDSYDLDQDEKDFDYSSAPIEEAPVKEEEEEEEEEEKGGVPEPEVGIVPGPVIPDLGVGDPNASGQFTFQVSTGRSDIGARVLMLFLGVLFGLGLGAICQYLGYWDKLIPPK